MNSTICSSLVIFLNQWPVDFHWWCKGTWYHTDQVPTGESIVFSIFFLVLMVLMMALWIEESTFPKLAMSSGKSLMTESWRSHEDPVRSQHHYWIQILSRTYYILLFSHKWKKRQPLCDLEDWYQQDSQCVRYRRKQLHLVIPMPI